MSQFLTIAEVAHRLSTTSAKVAEWAEAGDFPAPVALPDGEWRWVKRDVNSWMDSLMPSAAKQLRERGLIESDQKLGYRATPVGREYAPEDKAVRLNILGSEILQALSEAEGWLHGVDLARAVSPDADHTSGHWRDTLRLLRDAGISNRIA